MAATAACRVGKLERSAGTSAAGAQCTAAAAASSSATVNMPWFMPVKTFGSTGLQRTGAEA